MNADQDEKLPLEGLRVLEFCHTVMGPTAGLIFADLGADVIKIEPAPHGDRTRRLGGFGGGFFYALNRNKRSLVLDLKQDEGVAIAHKLAERTDVVLENYGPGTMDRLGCGYETLSAINPRLIYCALKGFLSGPYENRPALDEVVQYMTGLAYMTGPPGRPMRAGASVVDMVGGMFGVIAVQAALRDRERTGKGQLVRSSLFESCAFLVAQHMTVEVMSGERPLPMTARRGAWGIYDVLETSDDKMFLAITSNNHWQRFCKHFGREDLIEDPRFLSNEDRLFNRADLVPIVSDIVKQHSMAELSKVCEEIGIPFAPVAHPGDLFDDPHLNKGGHMVDIDFPNGQTRPIPGLPIEMETHRFGLRHQTPELGENVYSVLEELGMNKGEVDALIAGGVVVGK